jgi:hypothetical protein
MGARDLRVYRSSDERKLERRCRVCADADRYTDGIPQPDTAAGR